MLKPLIDAKLIARETGKPLWETKTEVGAVVNKVEISIEAYGERTPQRRMEAALGNKVSVRHKPHGVLAVLGPYNFPAHLPNGHIVPALIAGNAVVFKPSEKTPATGAFLVKCFHDAKIPEGVVRLTDEEIIHRSTSPASMQFCEMLLCALFRSWHLFAQESNGLTAHLASLLSKHGCQQVQARAYALQYQAGTPEGQAYAEDGVRVLGTLRPFLQKWGCMSKDYDAIRHQAHEEIQRPDFCATWHLLTAWGIRPRLKSQQPEP